MGIENSPIKVNRNLMEAVARATTPEELNEIMHAAAADQGFISNGSAASEATPSTYARGADGRFLPAEKSTSAPQVFKRTEVIGGRSLEFESDSLLGLEQAISAAFRVAEALQSQPQRSAEQNLVEKTDLDLAFRRGEIDPATYLERSGAVSEYLERQGVPIESLQISANQQFEKSWGDATAEFLASPEGASWPGGQQNLEVIGLTIAKLGLVNAPSKILALQMAYAEMQNKHLVFDPGPSADDILKSTANMSPQEILQQWKTQHSDPDAANQDFMRRFSSTGSSSSLFGQS